MPRKTPKQARAKLRRDVILQAARQVIDERGRDSFTTADITERAGCSIGTFYNYFRDRVDVLDVLYPDRVEGLDAAGLGRRSAEYSK